MILHPGKDDAAARDCCQPEADKGILKVGRRAVLHRYFLTFPQIVTGVEKANGFI